MDAEDRQWIESRFDKLEEKIERLESFINPKMAEHAQWIKNHERRHNSLSAGSWKLIAIIVASVGGLEGLGKLITYLASVK